MHRLTTLGELLSNSDKLNPKLYLYLPMDERWTLTTKCALLDTSDIDGNPRFAEQSGIEYAIGADTIQDVVENLKMQTAAATPIQLLDAFLFYYDNDAYITIER